MMCSNCGTQKDKLKYTGAKTGIPLCVKCYHTKYSSVNRIELAKKRTIWNAENPDRFKAIQTRYAESKLGKQGKARRAKCQVRRDLACKRANIFKLANPERYRLIQREYQASRRLLGGVVEPRETLRQKYDACPPGLEVDHIIPLKHDQVCGLHVSWNMQYLSRSENAKKSNAFDGTYENISWYST